MGKSAILEMDSVKFQELITNSISWMEVMIYFKENHGYRNLSNKNPKIRCVKENIDFSHFFNKGPGKRRKLSEILVKDSYFSSKDLRKRLVKEKILEKKCRDCGIEEKYNNKPITLHLEHINGDHFDNRIENLTILCPNCHSQTPTFGGRNKFKKKIKNVKCLDCKKSIGDHLTRCVVCLIKYNKIEITTAKKGENSCKDCNIKITKKSTRCISCSSKKFNTRKIENRPSLEQIRKDLDSMTMVKIGKKYGVSDNTIRNWIKAYV
jgi:Zn finger protein HypA/HybF involved in hydrogenase expression